MQGAFSVPAQRLVPRIKPPRQLPALSKTLFLLHSPPRFPTPDTFVLPDRRQKHHRRCSWDRLRIYRGLLLHQVASRGGIEEEEGEAGLPSPPPEGHGRGCRPRRSASIPPRLAREKVPGERRGKALPGAGRRAGGLRRISCGAAAALSAGKVWRRAEGG